MNKIRTSLILIIVLLILAIYFMMLSFTMPKLPDGSLIYTDWDEYEIQKEEYCKKEEKWCRFDIIKYFEDSGSYCNDRSFCEGD